MSDSTVLLTAESAKRIDKAAKDLLGISTLVLMENAGRQVAEEAVKMFTDKDRAAIFCGKGNNGGDGLVAARHLLAWGVNADIFLAGKTCEVRNEAKANLDILLKLRKRIIEVDSSDIPDLKNDISGYDLIIDAILGVGLSGVVGGSLKELINTINASAIKVLAVDIPSGLDATSGKVLGCCIEADKTVTFIAKKKGMVIGRGPSVCGQIIIKDLGIPLSSLVKTDSAI